MYVEGGVAFLQKRRGGCKTPPESCRGYPLNPPTTQKCRNRIRNSGRLAKDCDFNKIGVIVKFRNVKSNDNLGIYLLLLSCIANMEK